MSTKLRPCASPVKCVRQNDSATIASPNPRPSVFRWRKFVTVLDNRLSWGEYGTGMPPPETVDKEDGRPMTTFSTDSEFVYDPFRSDFGPLNLGHVWRYCEKVHKLLPTKHSTRTNQYVHSCAHDRGKRANSIFLICCYLMVMHGYTPDQAWLPFNKVRLTPFRDATYGLCQYSLLIIDCLRGLDLAMKVLEYNAHKIVYVFILS